MPDAESKPDGDRWAMEHVSCGGHHGETFPHSYACEVARGRPTETVPGVFAQATRMILEDRAHTNYNTGEVCYCEGDS